MSKLTRRELLWTSAALGGAALLGEQTAEAQTHDHGGHGGHGAPTPAKPAPAKPAPAKPAPKPSLPRPTPQGWQNSGTVITPNGSRLPWKVVDGVKVFHLTAEPVQHEFVEGLVVEAWGYNGSTPGPTIEVTEGDRCRFYVTNKLPEETTVHWHGILLPNGMDGVAGLTQKAIPVGETYAYEFTFTKAGTFMYHPHFDEMTQMALGMNGMIVVHPKKPATTRRVRDYAIMLHEWKIVAGANRPDPLAMNDFNLLTMNSRAYPGTQALVAEQGDLVRIRLGNLSPMDHHPIHVHGHSMEIVETDGGQVKPSARQPETTVLVPVGSVRVVELVADALGDWPLHCHMTHHVMTQMGHDTPNFIGVDVREADKRIGRLVPGYMSMGQNGMGGMGAMGMKMPKNSVPMKGQDGPFGLIDMGGMFTLLKVRDRLNGDGDPGWYAHPAGTVSQKASAAALARDGIDLD